MKKVFLDYGSTAPVCDAVLKNIQELAASFYNASSAYECGLDNKREIEKVREKVAMLINAEPEEIYFVSSASEGNSMCIDGFLKCHSNYNIVCSALEHSSIYDNPNIGEVIPCDEFGNIDIGYIELLGKSLFAVMHSSNEIGIVHPIKEVAEIVHRNGGYVLCDAASSLGKVPIDVKDLDVDFLTASGNKIGALKGAGFVYIKKGINIDPIIIGIQEKGLRGGTYNELAIKSLGIAIDELKSYKEVEDMRGYLVLKLSEIPNIVFNTHFGDGLPNLINIYIKDISLDSSQIVTLLDMYGFMVSASSACHSGTSTPSHVLKNIGLTDYEANHSIRITLGHENTYEDLDAFVKCLKNIIEMNLVSE